MPDSDGKHETAIQNLELQKKQLEYEKLKIEVEALKNGKQGSPLSWFDGRWFQACIAGIVAGALIWAFAIDHIKKLYELQYEQRKAQAKLELEVEEHKAAKIDLEKEIAVYQKKNEQLELAKTRTETTLNELRVQATLLSPDVSSIPGSLQKTNITIAELSNSLVDISAISDEKTPEKIWFPVIASAYRESDLLNFLEEIGDVNFEYKVAVYKTTDKKGTLVWAITLGGYLEKTEAEARVAYARTSELSPDAYLWKSEKWGENIIDDFR
ncbi:hypothetical protein LRP50_20555 [Enterovibrio sp. ZSDZ42]|uniref:SPOR domain-containing protein n=1 Tax=Enterovibrio gelatinilyticus TaxID=2899819 RepID=A0ABT5R7N1_9GAMM|nr:hypothetical protein [Enterovibrio sp. ZSDZ42]MDD1795522.1 hypothetical protein [Enterovibrio sp. ZSDZ42]